MDRGRQVTGNRAGQRRRQGGGGPGATVQPAPVSELCLAVLPAAAARNEPGQGDIRACPSTTSGCVKAGGCSDGSSCGCPRRSTCSLPLSCRCWRSPARRSWRRFVIGCAWALIGFFAVALVGLLLGLHLTEYRSAHRRTGASPPGPLSAAGAGAARARRRPGRRSPAGNWRAPMCGVLIAGMLVLQIVALVAVGTRYYT